MDTLISLNLEEPFFLESIKASIPLVRSVQHRISLRAVLVRALDRETAIIIYTLMDGARSRTMRDTRYPRVFKFNPPDGELILTRRRVECGIIYDWRAIG